MFQAFDNRWVDENIRGEAETKTLDVSSRGLRFDFPKRLESGSAVEILMTFPHEVTNAGPVRVHCRGRVVRTNLNHSDRVEVVSEIQRFHFVRQAS
jgi:hypothetical protein